MAERDSWWVPAETPPDPNNPSPNLEFDQMKLPDSTDDVSDELLTRRIHLLGTGSIGTLVAHSLRLLPNPPPLTLLLHRPEMYDDFRKGSRIVRLVNKNTEINDEQTGYDVDVIEQQEDRQPYWRNHLHKQRDGTDLNPLNDAERMENDEVFIYTLIVTVKGPATVRALQSIKHRVDSRTTILLMQNGMGQIDALNQQVFTDPVTRPTYMLGIISHGCYMQGPFAVVHAGFGTVALGIHRDQDKFPTPPKGKDATSSEISEEDRKKMFPTDDDLYSNISSRYLLRTLTRSPILACAAYPFLDLFQLQLEKLVTNCVLNPLTALLDVQNGEMLRHQSLTQVQRLLIAEISLVIRGMPELEGIPNARLRFAPSRLENLFRGISEKTGKNSSSMREDIRHAKATEIDFINGYIVKRGQEQGVHCVLNYMIMQLIKSKDKIVSASRRSSIPYGAGNVRAERMGDGVVLEDVSGPTS